MAEGIDIRHGRNCRSKGGGGCDCTPAFQAQVWDAKEGKRLSKTFPTRSAAKRWRQDSLVGLRSGALSAALGPRFEDAVEAWLDGLRAGHITTRSGDLYKPATIRGYESSLRLRAVPALEHLRLAEVTTKDVQALVDGLVKDGLASATIDADVTPLKALYRRAVGRGEVSVNPTLGIEKPAVRTKARRVVPHTDAEAMLGALDADDRALWATGFYAGLRMGELSALSRADIDLGAGVIRVQRGWDATEGYIATKNRKPRSVPVAAVLRDHLDEHLLTTDADEHIFGKPDWVRRSSKRARERWTKRGLPVLDLHEARHTYASFAIAAGLNAKTLSTYLGHATIQITLDLYGHLFPGAETEAAGLLDAYFARSVGGATAAPTAAHPARLAAQSEVAPVYHI
jgi:integrase